jgi:hypothetical protein
MSWKSCHYKLYITTGNRNQAAKNSLWLSITGLRELFRHQPISGLASILSLEREFVCDLYHSAAGWPAEAEPGGQSHET